MERLPITMWDAISDTFFLIVVYQHQFRRIFNDDNFGQSIYEEAIYLHRLNQRTVIDLTNYENEPAVYAPIQPRVEDVDAENGENQPLNMDLSISFFEALNAGRQAVVHHDEDVLEPHLENVAVQNVQNDQREQPMDQQMDQPIIIDDLNVAREIVIHHDEDVLEPRHQPVVILDELNVEGGEAMEVQDVPPVTLSPPYPLIDKSLIQGLDTLFSADIISDQTII